MVKKAKHLVDQRYIGDPWPYRKPDGTIGYRRPNLSITRPLRLVDGNGQVEPNVLADYIDGARWWIARSTRSERQLALAFEKQDVACWLYELVGAIIQLDRLEGGMYQIAIQLVNYGEDWSLDLSLSESGIYVDELWQDMEE